MGIVSAIVLFIVVTCAYIYSSHQLITMNNSLGPRIKVPSITSIYVQMGNKIINTNNDYARLCYIVFPSAVRQA